MLEVLVEDLVAEFIYVFNDEAFAVVLPRDNGVGPRIVDEFISLRQKQRQVGRYKVTGVNNFDTAVLVLSLRAAILIGYGLH